MARSLTELRKVCDEHCVVWGEKDGITDLTKKIAQKLVEDGIVQDPLPQIEVMNARKFEDEYEEIWDQNRVLNSPNWIAEPKLDGVHFKMHIGVSNNRFDSRRKSDTTYHFSEKTNNFPHLNSLNLSSIIGTVLDGEFIMPKENVDTGKTVTEGTLTASCAVANSGPDQAILIQKNAGWIDYHVFDVLFFKGRDVRGYSFEKRRKLIEAIFETLPESFKEHLKLVPQFKVNIKDAYEKYVRSGGEGFMLKRLDAPYESGKRTKQLLKWKKYYEVDAFVTGFVPATEGKGFEGLVGAMQFSVYLPSEKIHIIGHAQPGTLEFRKKISMPDGSLHPNMYNRVFEIKFQTLTKTNMARHCNILRYRPDKTPDMCVCDITKFKRMGVFDQ